MENDQTTNALRETPLPDAPSPAVPGKTVRTYASDVAEAMKAGQGSMVKIALAEEDRRREGGTPADAKTSRTFMIVSLILIALGIAIVVFIFISARKKPVSVVVDAPPPVIVTLDASRSVDITGMTRGSIKSRVADALSGAEVRLGSIEGITLVEQSGGLYTEVSADLFFTRIESAIPSALRRTLGKQIVFGVHALEGNGPFILLTTDSYATAFDAMLDYERTMFDELYDVFGIDATVNRYLFTSNFQDKVIKNQDTRALISSEGKPVFFYSFLGENKGVIIIATKDSTIEEVVRRLRGSAALSGN